MWAQLQSHFKYLMSVPRFLSLWWLISSVMGPEGYLVTHSTYCGWAATNHVDQFLISFCAGSREVWHEPNRVDSSGRVEYFMRHLRSLSPLWLILAASFWLLDNTRPMLPEMKHHLEGYLSASLKPAFIHSLHTHSLWSYTFHRSFPTTLLCKQSLYFLHYHSHYLDDSESCSE